MSFDSEAPSAAVMPSGPAVEAAWASLANGAKILLGVSLVARVLTALLQGYGGVLDVLAAAAVGLLARWSWKTAASRSLDSLAAITWIVRAAALASFAGMVAVWATHRPWIHRGSSLVHLGVALVAAVGAGRILQCVAPRDEVG